MDYLAAVYARVSTDDQKDAGTIANQIGEARRYARQTSGVLLGEMYLDDGVTSSVPFEERPSGKRLMEDARTAKFNMVLAFRLDRVERTARRLLQLEYELSQMGVTLVLISENIPPGGPQRQMALTMLAAFAEYEKSTIDERTTLGRHRILREGKWPGGRAAFGYKVQGTDLVIDEDEAAIVRMIFDLSVNQDIGEARIAKILNDMGIQNCSARRGYNWDSRIKNNKWSSGRIGGILRNTIYKGTFIYGKTGTKMGKLSLDVPAIVDPELWDRANERLKVRTRQGRPAIVPFLLKGLIRCGACGSAVIGQNISRPTKHYSYYRCNYQYRNNHGEEGCRTPFMPRYKLEDIVWNDIQWFVTHPGQTLHMLDDSARIVDEEAQQLKEELARLDAILGAEAEERRRVTSLYREGLIGDTEVREQLELMKAKHAELNTRKGEIFERLYQAEESEKRRKSVEALLDELRSRVEDVDWQSKRELVTLLVDHIILDAVEVDGKRRPGVTIHYHFPSFTKDPGSSDNQGQRRVGHLQGLATHEQPRAQVQFAKRGDSLRGLLVDNRVVVGGGVGCHRGSLIVATVNEEEVII